MNNLRADATELMGGSPAAAPARAKRKDDWQTTKRGHNFFEVLSAFQKAIRRGDGKLAGYWALESTTPGSRPIFGIGYASSRVKTSRNPSQGKSRR